MRKVIALLVVLFGTLAILAVTQASAADSRIPITKQPNVASPPTYSRTPANPSGPATGAVVQGNQIHALPGYFLQPAPNNQLMLRSNGGGPGLGASFYGCGCVGGTGGTCTVSTDGKDSGSCYKGSNDTCTGECKFETVTIPQGGLMAR